MENCNTTGTCKTMRNCLLYCGEKIFHVLVILAIIAGTWSGVLSGMSIGGMNGVAMAVIQIVISWSGTLIIALIVYSLLDIRRSLQNK